MSEEIEKKLELIPKIWKLLRSWSTYYVLLVVGLGYWLFNDETRIRELNIKIEKNDSIHKADIREMQKKLEDRNCIEVFKVWKEALEPKYEQEQKQAMHDLEIEKRRTEELNETYKLLKNSK